MSTITTRPVSALIGHTGFVGSNLARQYPFDAFYNSKNVEEIAGRSFDFLAISAMPAAMWIANKDPAGDRAVLDRLVTCLRQVQARQVVLMSTVAVFPQAVDVDEDSPIDTAAQTAYGRHRLMLEEFVAERFPGALTVRLPGLFGQGLKKNAIHDLLWDHEVHKVHSEGVYQFYDLSQLESDVSKALANGLKLVHFATEPMSVREVAREAFDREFLNDTGVAPARFDMRSKFAALWGGQRGYLFDRSQVLTALRTFLAAERVRGRPQ